MTQTVRRAPFDAVLAALIPVCGLLDVTAVFNTATYGIGVFYPLTGLLALRLWRDRVPVAFLWREDRALRALLSLLILFMALLWLAMAMQGLALAREPGRHFAQGVARSMPVVFAGLSAIFITLTRTERIMARALLAFGAVYLLYGLYDFAAQAVGAPRVLDFLRNNSSAYISRNTGGWIDLPRVTSLSAEPAATSMPTAMIIAAIWMGLPPGWRRRAALAVAATFIIGTFSRTLWLVFIGSAAAIALAAVLLRLDPPRLRPLVAAGLLAVALAGPGLLLYARSGISGEGSDYSVMERQDSTRAALLLFLESPATGRGLAGLEDSYRVYANTLSNYQSVPPAIHNALGAYLGTLGILGLVIYSLPLLAIAGAAETAPLAAVWWMASFVLTGQAYDNFYFPSSWTALTLLFVIARTSRLRTHPWTT